MKVRAFERPLAGLACAVTSVASFFLLLGLFLGLAEVQASSDRGAPSPPCVQGNVVIFPKETKSFVSPVVMRDGSLEPEQETIRFKEEIYDGIVRFYSKLDCLNSKWDWIVRFLFAPKNDYRYRSRATKMWIPPDLEYGWLLREGRESYYLASDGVYRVNHTAHTYRLVQRVDSPIGYQRVIGSGCFGEVTVGCVVLTASHIYYIDSPGFERLRSWKVPASVSGLGDYEYGLAFEGNLVLRAEMSRPASGEFVDYRVAVLDRFTWRWSEYSYRFQVEGARIMSLAEWDDSNRTAYVDRLSRTLGGLLAGAFLAPVWRLAPAALPDALQWRLGIPFWVLGGTWKGIALSIAMALLMLWLIRRQGRSWRASVIWGAVVFVVGLPGLLTYLLLCRVGRVETCASCGSRFAARHAACPRCGCPAALPKTLGIEIMRRA
ncbi:MAG: hypothetical protein HYY16_09565 [Planctomycetes bacterium]|nr:hypothetical protein [Planctomycetota bacterium]